MRQLTLIILLSVIWVGTAVAQDTTVIDHAPRTYIMKKKGRLLEVNRGRTRKVKKDVTLVNGTTIHRDGTINESSGKTKKLEEGEYITMDGRIRWLKDMDTTDVRR